MIIKKIFDKEIDESIHSDFLKFGRGEFADKYVIEAKKQKDKWAIKTGPEFANFFVKKCLFDLGSMEIEVKGVIVSTFDLINEVKFDIVKKKNFMGIKQIVINTTVSSDEILDLMERFPRAFFALTFNTKSCQLKIKAKAPKNSKASKKDGGEVKADFCSLKTTNKKIVKEILFDVDVENFKELKITHVIDVQDIIYPKDEKDPKMIREKSQRKGVLTRKLNVDGKVSEKQAEFVA